MLYNKVARRFALFNDNPSSEGGEGGDPASGGGSSVAGEAEKVVRSLLARAGVVGAEVPDGARKVMRKLAKENHKYRGQLREMKDKVVPDGSRILTDEEAKAYDAFIELGKPEDVKKALDTVPTLEKEVGQFRLEKTARTAADALKFNANVLADLITNKGLVVEMRETEVAGKKVDLPHVKSGEAWEPLATYVERDLKDYLPALRQGASEGGILYPEQDGTGGKVPTSHEVVGKATAQFVRPSKLNNNS